MVFLCRLLFLITSLFLFYSVPEVYASDSIYFFDDFNSLDRTNWNVNDYQNEVNVINDGVDDKILRIASPIDTEFPFLKLNRDLNALDEFTIEVKYRMLQNGFGSGLILTDKILPAYSSFEMQFDDFIIVTWPVSPIGYKIVPRPCPKYDTSCAHNDYRESVDYTSDKEWHVFRFIYSDGSYKVYKDGLLVYESEITEKKIRYIYFGSPLRTSNPTAWPTHDLDYIKISVKNQNSTNKIIVIPGLGTSWDIGSLINGNSGGNWEVPKFVDLYDSLIKSIENNGYEREKDLFVFGYDWRKTLDSLADDLDIYLKTKLDDGEKAILVGHSMGGMVARAYAQKYGSEKIDKLVTLGSPHKGVLEAYSAWEGATVWGDIWWEKAALELAIHLNNRGGQSRVDTLRSQAPSIKDLLPTYDYLNKNGSIIPWSQTVQKNEYVTNLNRDIGELDSLTKIFAGVSGQTKEILKVINRTDADRLLNRWEDGRPISDNPFIFGAGDGTVTRTSAVGPFSSIREINRWHNELVYERDSIEAVISELGLDPSKVEIIEPDTRSDVLAIILRSPGKLLVCNVSENACGDELGLNIPAYKLFLLPGYNGEKISVRVLEEGQGKYDLHVGYIANDEDWEVIKGNIEGQNQTDRYYLEGKENEISINLDEETRNRNELIVSGNLSVFSPNWDKKGYFNQARDSRINPKIRIKYIKLLRTVLRGEFKKAIKQNNFDYLEAVNNVWKANDRLAYVILAGESVVRERVVDSYFGRVNKFSETVLKRMAKSKGVMPTHTYEFAMEKLDEIGQITTNNTDLRSDQLMSAEYLLYSVLDSL